MFPYISIIIPAHNEEKRIGRTLGRFFKILPHWIKETFEIIVVLNGCNDTTHDIVQLFSNKYPYLHFENFQDALGKGKAVMEGFKLAKGEYVSFIDADGATGPFDFIRIVKSIDGYDGAIASRWLRSSKRIRQPFSRKVISRGFNLLVRLLLQIPYTDTQCGAKVFKRTVINTIIHDLGLNGFTFDVELLYRLHKKGFKIREVPIRWKHHKGSSLKLWKDIPTMFFSVCKLRMLESPLKFMM